MWWLIVALGLVAAVVAVVATRRPRKTKRDRLADRDGIRERNYAERFGGVERHTTRMRGKFGPDNFP